MGLLKVTKNVTIVCSMIFVVQKVANWLQIRVRALSIRVVRAKVHVATISAVIELVVRFVCRVLDVLEM